MRGVPTEAARGQTPLRTLTFPVETMVYGRTGWGRAVARSNGGADVVRQDELFEADVAEDAHRVAFEADDVGRLLRREVAENAAERAGTYVSVAVEQANQVVEAESTEGCVVWESYFCNSP